MREENEPGQSGPQVSIIMPAYNAERHIGEAVRSVIGQSYQEWELIIVNDGSTDGTQACLDFFSDPRILVIHQQNRGVSAARNAALDAAKGEYITFLDADDLLPPGSLQVRAAHLEAHPEVDIVDGVMSFLNESMDAELRRHNPSYRGELFPRLIRLDDRVFALPFYMFRATCAENVRFNERLTHLEDILFYICMSANRDMQYGYVDEPVYLYRTGHGSAMSNLFGIEKGYFELLGNIKGIPSVSAGDVIYLRIKIAKILFLSWCSAGKLTRGVSAALQSLLGKTQGGGEVHSL